jgi:hypothetical protein
MTGAIIFIVFLGFMTATALGLYFGLRAVKLI